MDEREIITRLESIRRLADDDGAIKAADAAAALMQEMTFGAWPDDPAERITADPLPAHTRPARPPLLIGPDPKWSVIIDAGEGR